MFPTKETHSLEFAETLEEGAILDASVLAFLPSYDLNVDGLLVPLHN